jgi:hypothetical protein
MMAAVQRHACLVAEGNHDVREAVLEIDCVHVRIRVTPPD